MNNYRQFKDNIENPLTKLAKGGKIPTGFKLIECTTDEKWYYEDANNNKSEAFDTKLTALFDAWEQKMKEEKSI